MLLVALTFQHRERLYSYHETSKSCVSFLSQTFLFYLRVLAHALLCVCVCTEFHDDLRGACECGQNCFTVVRCSVFGMQTKSDPIRFPMNFWIACGESYTLVYIYMYP